MVLHTMGSFKGQGVCVCVWGKCVCCVCVLCVLCVCVAALQCLLGTAGVQATY